MNCRRFKWSDESAVRHRSPQLVVRMEHLKDLIMMNKGTVIVTGGSQGIGAAVVKSFLDRGYAVVATARKASQSALA